MNEAIFQFRFGRCVNMSAEGVEWLVGKCCVNEKFVNIDFCVTDRFILGLRLSSRSFTQHVGSQQIFRQTSTVIQPLEDMLSSSDFGKEVADMLVHVIHDGHIFNRHANYISDFIYRNASTLGLEYQMLRITIKLEDLVISFCEDTFFFINYITMNLENVECNIPADMSEPGQLSLLHPPIAGCDANVKHGVFILQMIHSQTQTLYLLSIKDMPSLLSYPSTGTVDMRKLTLDCYVYDG
ncbi:hypothetical protein QJS10_CPA07g00654 [Acorus calamus]|uniref:Uncharacterized protein n=1 Tax=Acorus calamus TaxID=4465 RepID=A0AAV9EL01_ACOCL|nr:hypothetical protein QJS10_CPA07g00654 [Acorus calamus]